MANVRPSTRHLKNWAGGPLKDRSEIDGVDARHSSSFDLRLLEIIDNNIQRVPVNDNMMRARKDLLRVGFPNSMISTLGFVGILLLGVVIMAVFRLVPASHDSQD